jgi:hypothetical protein
MQYKVMKLIGVGMAAGCLSVSAMAAKPIDGTDSDGDPSYKGNGAPSGSHYTLNILGMEKSKGKTEAETLNSNGRRIFVDLGGSTRILLTMGEFDVIDYDGTDGMATFQLPNPDPNCTGTTEYSVFVRGLGGGGSADIETCIEDKTTGDTYCSSTDSESNVVKVSGPKGSGAAKFENVSRQLLYVTIEGKRYPLFADSNYYYFWDYDNKGLRLAQMRFYEIPTAVSDVVPEPDCHTIEIPED